MISRSLATSLTVWLMGFGCESDTSAGAAEVEQQCADFDEADACSRASEDDLPCLWYEVQRVSDSQSCEADVAGACLQRIKRGGTLGCGAPIAYFAEGADGTIDLVSQCGDNPPQGYSSCGAEGAPEACACWVAP